MLAEALSEYKSSSVVVLALPRGGVVLGVLVSHALDAPLSLVIPRKIGAQGNEEYAIGAIVENGEGVFNEAEVARADKDWLDEAIAKERAEAVRRREKYLGDTPIPELKDKTVILVDDGIATGLTMRAAVQYVRALKPEKIVVAVPVSPSDSVHELKKVADEVVVLEQPEMFMAIGSHYEEFPQVTDEEVIEMLKDAK